MYLSVAGHLGSRQNPWFGVGAPPLRGMSNTLENVNPRCPNGVDIAASQIATLGFSKPVAGVPSHSSPRSSPRAAVATRGVSAKPDARVRQSAAKKANRTPAGSVPRQPCSLNGRWSVDEHNAFIEALAKYGRNWKEIARHVVTRTTVQVRTHAQKYFLKCKKTGQAEITFDGSGNGSNRSVENRRRTSSSTSNVKRKRKASVSTGDKLQQHQQCRRQQQQYQYTPQAYHQPQPQQLQKRTQCSMYAAPSEMPLASSHCKRSRLEDARGNSRMGTPPVLAAMAAMAAIHQQQQHQHWQHPPHQPQLDQQQRLRSSSESSSTSQNSQWSCADDELPTQMHPQPSVSKVTALSQRPQSFINQNGRQDEQRYFGLLPFAPRAGTGAGNGAGASACARGFGQALKVRTEVDNRTLTPVQSQPQPRVSSSAYTKKKSGRWTDLEHANFVRGLRKYGRNWSLISQMVRTRTTVQVRTHAQKYFLKQQKDGCNMDTPSRTVDHAQPQPAQDDNGRPRTASEDDDDDTETVEDDASADADTDDESVLMQKLPAQTRPPESVAAHSPKSILSIRTAAEHLLNLFDLSYRRGACAVGC